MQAIGDAYYGAGDEVQSMYEPLEFGESGALVAGGIDEAGHIQAADLFGVKKAQFYIKTPTGATLEQLQANAKSGLYWELPEELKSMLRHVVTPNNRSNPQEADLEGSLNKALFVGAKVVSYFSDCPKDLALDLPGIVPQTFTSTGRHNYVVPANCSNTVVNQSIFEPDNYFTKYMYAHNQKCDLKTLQQHIRFDMDPQKQFAVMNTHGVGWKVLSDNLYEAFAPAAESILAKNAGIIDSPYPQLAQVPYDVAQSIYESIAAPLREIEKAYVDLASWKARFSPADKEPWNSVNGLVRESTVFGADSTQFEVESKLNTPFSAGVLLEVEYVLGQ